MRQLQQSELSHVSGGTYSCGCYCPPSKNQPGKGSRSRSKNNNGFGNGPESGPAPGNSGKTGGGKAENRGR